MNNTEDEGRGSSDCIVDENNVVVEYLRHNIRVVGVRQTESRVGKLYEQ